MIRWEIEDLKETLNVGEIRVKDLRDGKGASKGMEVVATCS